MVIFLRDAVSARSKSLHALPFPPSDCPLSHLPQSVPADDKECETLERSTPDGTETDTKAPVGEEDQPPADDTDAGTPTLGSPESPSAEKEVEPEEGEAVADPTTVLDSPDAVGEVAAPVEMEAASATGEGRQQGVGCTPGFVACPLGTVAVFGADIVATFFS